MNDNLLTQIHIEAARNSTDDFNLFHDKNRWGWVKNNPFEGPIALGFQLGCLVEDSVNVAREKAGEQPESDGYQYSHFELNFAGVVKPGDRLEATVKTGRLSSIKGQPTFSNRVLVKANDKAVLIGYKRDSDVPMFAIPSDLPCHERLAQLTDRTVCSDSAYFLKRKFMIVGNAKNFLTSAFAQQADYIDEFADKVQFPQMYPVSLLSSALLERARVFGHDLIAEPMIYASHKISVDRAQLNALKSNDKLHILIGPEQRDAEVCRHLCYGMANQASPLFIAQIELLPLSFLVKAQ